MTFLLYGANGYTGTLIAERAHQLGLRPIVAGRSRTAVAAIAGKYGFDYRVFPLDSAEQIARSLEGVQAVLLAAGPFSATSAPVLEACIRTGVHYLDITGEVAVFEQCVAQHERARAAGCVVLPGVGFDVVPSDCLAAALAELLPRAQSLELAFASAGGQGPGVSRGTAKTMLEGFGGGGAIREDGHITRVPMAWRTRTVPFRDRPRTVASISWGDVSTAYHSTGIPSIVVYTAIPRRQIRLLKLAPLLAPISRIGAVRRFIVRRIERGTAGPGEHARATGTTQLWGRVADAAGRSVEGTLVTPEAYRLTADTAVESMRRVMTGNVAPGFHTPSSAFGSGFISEFEGCNLRLGDANSSTTS
jgi:short subunit dehydrogenase-like uncharacterized protein